MLHGIGAVQPKLQRLADLFCVTRQQQKTRLQQQNAPRAFRVFEV